jgi:cytochrome P450
MSSETLLERIMAPESRPNPWPLYAELRETPVAAQADGSYLVGTYDEITTLLHDPRLSSDVRRIPSAFHPDPGELPAFLDVDPPDHDRLRRMAMRQFGPPRRPDRVAELEPQLIRQVDEMVGALEGRSEFDLVDDFAYPFPVTVMCGLLGVEEKDEPKFHRWTEAMIAALGARFGRDQEAAGKLAQEGLDARAELREYLVRLIDARRRAPGDDLLSGLVTVGTPDGMMNEAELRDTAVLLLLAGHETTVNLIGNGMLTLLRHPEMYERVRNEDGFVINVVEELLRFEPPVHLLFNRSALADIEIAGMTIPAGAMIVLAIASGNRDPKRYRDPDRFDPERPEREHLGFGGGIHHCFGAPLARLEAYAALTALTRRLENPRLVQDPPPYRPSPLLRGPLHLPVAVDGVRPA